MSDDDRERMAANARELLNFSQKMLSETSALFQMEQFHATPLMIPPAITDHATSLQIPSHEQTQQQVNQLYAAQKKLFTPDDLLEKPVTPEPHSDSQLDEINKMLGM